VEATVKALIHNLLVAGISPLGIGLWLAFAKRSPDAKLPLIVAFLLFFAASVLLLARQFDE
jgi:hypothetical protein